MLSPILANTFGCSPLARPRKWISRSRALACASIAGTMGMLASAGGVGGSVGTAGASVAADAVAVSCDDQTGPGPGWPAGRPPNEPHAPAMPNAEPPAER